MFRDPKGEVIAEYKFILTNAKEFGNRVYYIVLNVLNKDRLERESTYRVILERLRGKSLGYINTYRGRDIIKELNNEAVKINNRIY